MPIDIETVEQAIAEIKAVRDRHGIVLAAGMVYGGRVELDRPTIWIERADHIITSPECFAVNCDLPLGCRVSVIGSQPPHADR